MPFIDKQWSSGRKRFQFDIMIYQYFSHFLFFNSTSNKFYLGINIISDLIFGRVWIDTVDLYVYVNVGAGWVHSDDERYFQSFC